MSLGENKRVRERKGVNRRELEWEGERESGCEFVGENKREREKKGVNRSVCVCVGVAEREGVCLCVC